MNSYNENLHSGVSTSLGNQETALKKAQAQLDATMFSLYYAQGNYITIYEKLGIENNKYQFNQKLYNEMVIDSDLSTNLLSSVNQGKTLVTTSISNASVAASNVQIASNAILKLASDMGSIFNIVSAADFDSEIYQQSKDANSLMSETAYLAEVLSQYSMKTSSLIAEVSAEKLSETAATSDASVKNLLQVVKTEFDKAATQVNNDNNALAQASTDEKKLEGSLEDAKVNYDASKDAYAITNQELNLDLVVTKENLKGREIKYTVSFLPYQSPFGVENAPSGYPVDNYYIFLVKESKKKTFSMSVAEGILVKDPEAKGKNGYPYIVIKGGKSTEKGVSKTLMFNALEDTDEDALQLGENYVVFVLASLSSTYKKLINNFEDYLTAPSASFSLTNQLIAPVADDIKVGNEKTEKDKKISLESKIISAVSISREDLAGKNTESKKIVNQVLSFPTNQNTHFKVEYRCMFLPDNSELIKGLLTNQELLAKEEEAKVLEQISNKYDPKISELELKINALESELEVLEATADSDIEAWVASVENSIAAKKTHTLEEVKTLTEGGEDNIDAIYKKLGVKKSSEKIVEKDILKIIAVMLEIALAKIEFDALKKSKEEAFKGLDEKALNLHPGFMFNETIAERVTASNYFVASPSKDDDQNFEVKLKPEMTDNFGNRLIPGSLYIPVVLVVNNQGAEISKQFSSALSDFQNTKPFTYKYKN
ncbi:hypothetical protein P8625_00680 [Tenacibaculum tangerinum]|uniref:Uncharacterized protein n=1 Tax=Tenacibaculum tangerinum TaxID=3038772 RepID=A0ABY8L6Z6_9FLAO|nr:hypothetical protein [Tenacibaculum tangerinum]WGH75710.1 hypothetical protein P8625_00680 [Tenacibaculum tangerinum]